MVDKLNIRLSLKSLAIIQLSSIGIIVVLLALYQSLELQGAAKRSQERSSTKILDVSSVEILHQTEKLMTKLSDDLTKDRGLRKKIKRYRKQKTTALKSEIVKSLDEQFFQKFVTAELLRLKKIRVFDLDFNLLIESQQGDKNIDNSLDPNLKDIALPRKKSDRLKRLSSLWTKNDTPYFSILLPIGGLRLIGYLEIITSPVHNLKSLQKMTTLPIKMNNLNGEPLFTPEAWETLSNENNILISKTLTNENDEPILVIQAIENTTEMTAEFTHILQKIMLLFTVTVLIGGFIMLKAMDKILLQPVHHLVDQMDVVAEGDMRRENVPKERISELILLQSALDKLTLGLRGHIQHIWQTGGNLTNAALLLGEDSKKTVANIKNQQDEIANVTNATNSLMVAVQKVAETALDTSSFSQLADTESIEGKEVVMRAVKGITSLSNEISNAAKEINLLQTDIQNVDSILEVIQNISEQTNLLALNAAIEAARAGEQGRGFAVVADEVRALAARSRDATEEVKTILLNLRENISGSVETMNRGTELANQSVILANDAGKSLSTITENVSKLKSMNIDIADVASEQVQTTAEISMFLLKIHELASNVSASTLSLNSNSADLTQMANQLEDLVSKFKLDVATEQQKISHQTARDNASGEISLF